MAKFDFLKERAESFLRDADIEKILKEKPNLISDLNQAYLTSRYLPV